MKHQSVASRWRLPALTTLLMGLLVGACVASATSPDAAGAQVVHGQRYPLQLDGHLLQVELAATSAARAQGLMHRTKLAADAGMLFVFSAPQRLSFWMRNTLIPLDIGFFDGTGVLREIYTMEPLKERPVISEGVDLVYALEVNQGWFDAHSVAVGTRVDLQQVQRALERAAHRQ